MKEMLERLKVADPALWEEIYQSGFNHCHWPDDLIQGCVQRAIAARWDVSGITLIHIGNKYKAAIRYKSTFRFDGEGDSWPMALLAAYLEALEV
jgi:hypothetical protein